jgi:DegV family protein with EDD domain
VYQERFDSGFTHILSIHLSAKLSGMINVVNQAAQKFGDRVHIFDSRSVSLGLGFQVMEAAQAVAAGCTIPTIFEKLRQAREKVGLIAMLDTQDYLMRSGRVSWATASLGKILRIRVLVGVEDGEVVRKALVRTRSHAIEKLKALGRSWGPLLRLAILHTDTPEEAKLLAGELSHLSTTTPLIVDVTTLLGVHVGPNALGLAGLCI